ncbi:hypothetical protein EUGRSUZ_D01890 [Eucalyptus grandis]|uniref:Thaumatin-like protein n=1 Tax=Eucalyptus grandis TaxID=71139 RepID=A0A059CI25_EUCGR|nr:hypothetical protein EUGRSUZ_D01890 [Eucalyptus grandis]
MGPLIVAPGMNMAHIWARTNCNFHANGQTGGCNRHLDCQGWGSPPNTSAEFALNQPNNRAFLDISLVDGFNIPMDFNPTTGACRGIGCAVDINGRCLAGLKAHGGCNNLCTVFKTNGYCCTDGLGSRDSQFFKNSYPDAYPQGDPTTTFTCPSGTNYKVTFCP